jgi:hypothetical protein
VGIVIKRVHSKKAMARACNHDVRTNFIAHKTKIKHYAPLFTRIEKYTVKN